MTDFKIRRGRSTDLFKDGLITNGLADGVVLENGCWYLCTDTAELFVCVSETDNLILKKVNDYSLYNFITSDVLDSKDFASKDFVISEISKLEFSDINHTHDEYLTSKDLDGYSKFSGSYTDLTNKPEIPSIEGLATESFVTNKIAEAALEGTDVDLSGFATKDELKAFPTKDYVDNAIANIEHPTIDFSEYAKKEELPSIEGLATEEFVDKKIAAIELPETDLSDYALRSEIPSIDGLASKTWVADQGYITDISSKADVEHVHDNYAAKVHEHSQYLTEQDISSKSDVGHTHDDLYDIKGAAAAVKSELLNGAEEAYDTLKELGELIQANGDVIKAIEENSANKADKEHKHTLADITDYLAPDFTGYAKESWVQEKIDAIPTPEVDDFALKTDLAGLATEDFVKNAIAEAQLKDSEVDLSDYATKDDLVGFASTSYVDEKVAAISIPEVSDFITIEDVAEAGYIQTDALNNYASKDDVTTAINEIESDLDSYAKTSWVEAKIAEEIPNLTVPTKVSELVNDMDFITLSDVPLADYYNKSETSALISTVVDKIDIPDTSDFITMADVEAKDYLTLSDISTKADTEHKHDDLYETKGAAETIKNELLSGVIDTCDTLGEFSSLIKDNIDTVDALEVAIANKADIVHIHEEYAQRSELFSGNYEDLSNTPTIPDAYDDTELRNLISNKADSTHSHTNYAEKEFVHENYYTKLEVDEKIPSLDGYAKSEDIPTNYLTAADLDGYSKFSGSYNDLTDKPSLEDYALTSEVAIKANNVLFTADKYVTVAFGSFAVGESVKGLTMEQIIAKLLGLSDDKVNTDPDIPTEPDNVVDNIVTNKLPMYSVNTSGEVVELSYDDVTTYTSTTADQQPTQSGFYQIVDDEGTVIESGYQELTVINPDVPYIIALPADIDFNSMVTVKTYDTLENTWKVDSIDMSNDYNEISALCAELGVDISHIDTTKYTLWADLEAGPTGKIHRFIITN